MYVYIYIHIYKSIYIYICMYIYIYTHTHTNLPTHANAASADPGTYLNPFECSLRNVVKWRKAPSNVVLLPLRAPRLPRPPIN